MNSTGEVLSGSNGDESFKESKYGDTNKMTGQFGGENIQDKFTKNSAKNSRNAM